MLKSIHSLSLEKKVGQLFFIGIPGTELDPAALNLLSEVSPGGICLFARNVREAEQTRRLLDKLLEVLPVTPFLSIDQEGGRVDRLRRVIEPMPAAASLRSLPAVTAHARINAEILRILGFNMNFAPVADVIDENRGRAVNGLETRTFGADRETAAEFARAYLETLQEGGIVGCLKHFPGLGASVVDSHEELPVVPVEAAEFEATDLFPYRALIGRTRVEAVMMAHAAFPQLDLQEKDSSGKLLPSSLSPRFIHGLLRGRLGYNGLVLTDDLEMGAIVRNYGMGEACRMAIAAGEDLLLVCNHPEQILEGYRAVLNAVYGGEISEQRIDESLSRITGLKERLAPPLTFDRNRLDVLSKEISSLKESIQ